MAVEDLPPPPHFRQMMYKIRLRATLPISQRYQLGVLVERFTLSKRCLLGIVHSHSCQPCPVHCSFIWSYIIVFWDRQMRLPCSTSSRRWLFINFHLRDNFFIFKAALRKVASMYGEDMLSTSDIKQLIQPKIMDSYLMCSKHNESFV